ncbi:MAG: hypothetical protein WBG10_03250 [Pseudolabrys sp.]
MRARYALFVKWGNVLRVFYIVAPPLGATLVAALIILEFHNDLFEGMFFAGTFVCMAALWWFAFRYPKTWRWVDIASSGFYPRGRLWPLTSDAQLVEEQIAEREQRLSELKTAETPSI